MTVTQVSSTSTRNCWLALNRAPGASNALLLELLSTYESPCRLIASAGRMRHSGLSASLKRYLASPDWAGVARDVAFLDASSCRLIDIQDPGYPSRLHDTPDPPLVLFVSGDGDALDRPSIAIVGARNCTHSARQIAHDFAGRLGAAGLTVVSGMARGIDAAVHRGALEAGGLTVAVAGCGADIIYPRHHRDLAREIEKQGARVTEYPCGVPPRPENFPRRNRIISALSLGVVVVEAAFRSGSLITARLAMEQGREVFAVPGSIHNPMTRGCHALIHEGAKLVESVEDILVEIAPQLAGFASASGPTRTTPADVGVQLDEQYLSLLKAIDYEPTHANTLIQRTRLTPDVVSSMLLQLELNGYITAVSGGSYSRCTRKVK